jgi:calcium/calmodulin-dependent protein kinase I
MRNLKHENLMNLYGVYETKNSIYMIIELLGSSLYDQVKALHNFDLGESRKAMRSILKGLTYIHSKGYMHRDLKLENILYKKSTQEYVIADFGLTENNRS